MSAVPIEYTPSTISVSDVRFDTGPTNWFQRFGGDPVLGAAGSHTLANAAALASSPYWEDRVRAQVIAETSAAAITLPDGFPCIYEPADSPRNAGVLHPRPFAWVISPDEEMLIALLPLYQELWDAYQSQWPSPGRVFTVGRLDGLSPRNGVYRPGTTPEQIIAQTLLTHDGMYRRAPEHLKKMHPRHEQWTTDRTETPR